MASLLYWTVDPTTLLAVAVAIFGPIGAYIVAARKMSGRIANSDAEQLWTESKAIRDWSSARIDIYEREIADLRAALSRESNKSTGLESENKILKKRLEITTNRIEELIQIMGKKGNNG